MLGSDAFTDKLADSNNRKFLDTTESNGTDIYLLFLVHK
jgi:hypothetical protein